MPRPCSWVLALGAVICGAPHAALADGTIVTTDADIASGEGSPRGRTILDQLAPPALEPVIAPRLQPAPLPELASDIPAPPDDGDGQEDFLVTTGNTTILSGGVHDYATFTVEADAAVQCLHSVTIRVSGPVSIQGAVTSSDDGASITFVCGGDFEMGTGANGASPSIGTTGLGAPVTIDAMGSVSCDAASGRVSSAHGRVTLLQRAYASTLILRGVEVSGADAVSVRSEGSIALTDVSVAAGDIELYAFNGIVSAIRTELSASGALRARSQSLLSLTDVAATSAGAVELTAVHGRVLLTGATIETAPGSSGDFSVRADVHAMLSRSTLRHRGTGTLEFRTTDVILENPHNTTAVEILHEGSGDVRMVLDGMVVTYGRSTVVASHGDVVMHAFLVQANGEARFSAIAGTLDLSVDRAVALRADPYGELAGLPDLEAGTIRITARDDAAYLAVDRADAGFGGMTVTVHGNVLLRGTFASVGPVAIRSSYGGIDLAGSDVSTAPATGHATAPIVIETSYSYERVIDATGARIRSGEATAGASGDVVLAAHSYFGYACGTCRVDDGAVPGFLEAVAIDAHSVRLSWMPRDREGTGFVVERRSGEEPFEVVATVGAEDPYLTDEGLAPDTEYDYRVSVLTSVLTSAPSEFVRVRTKSNIGVRVRRASVVNMPLLASDTVALSLKVRFFERPRGEAFDPTVAPLRIAVGNAFVLLIPAGDPRWTLKGRAYEWTGPVGDGGDATVRVAPASGRIDLKAKGYGVVQAPSDRSYVSVRAGADGGSKTWHWRAGSWRRRADR